MDSLCDEPLNIDDGSNVARIGLVVDCHTDGAIGVVGAVVMVMKGDCQGGEDQQADKKR